MSIKQGFQQAPNVKIMINIGALLDIPTGTYVKGLHGESILNGGLGILTGVVGIGNNFKSTMLHYMMLSAADHIAAATETSMSTYDTEVNIHETNLQKFGSKFDSFKDIDFLNDGTWVVTDKTVYYANDWLTHLKEFLASKLKDAKKLTLPTPFPDRTGKTNLTMLTPTFSEVDSFSEFETESTAKIQDDNELGDSGGQMIHMRSGLDKTRFLMESPRLAGGHSHYMLFTAHVGKDIPMASGPFAPPPTKKLQHLKHGDKIKGVTDKFFFLMSNVWHAFNAQPLLNTGTKGPEYPKSADMQNPGDMDLNIVSLRQLRSKSGPTGLIVQVVVSQREGVLPSLTEFHYIRTNDYYGLEGNNTTYSLALYPDLKLTRPTVRQKIDSDPKLRRALTITAELLQMKNLWHHMDDGILCDPKVLYEDLKAKGYDWDVLLNTRGWWTLNNDKHPIPFLSTMDLLNMRAGTYHPYWMDKKQVKTGV